MSTPEALTLEHASRWGLRVPSLVLTVGPITVAVLALASIWNEPGGLSGDVDEVTSWASFLIGVPIGAALAALVLGWFAPRPGAWAMAVAVFPPLVGDALFPDGGTWFTPVAWAWIGVVFLDLALVLRQRELAFWAPTLGRNSTPARWQADHHLGIRLVAGALLGSVIVVCFVAFGNWRGDARALAARAVPTEVTVVSSDTAFDAVEADVDGKRHEFLVNDASEHPVGSALVVYRDPTGTMRPYNPEDADPDGWSMLGLPAGGAGFALYLVLVEIGRRRRRVEALASSEDPGVGVLVRWHPVHEGLEVFAREDRAGEQPVAFLPALEPLVPRAKDTPTGIRGGVRDLVDLVRFFVGAPELDRASAEKIEDLGAYVPDPSDGIQLDVLQEATVLGMASDGAVCVIRFPEDGPESVVASVRPVRDRWTVRTLVLVALDRVLPSGKGKRKARPGDRARAVAISAHEDMGEDESPSPLVLRVTALFRRTAPASVPAVVLLGWFGVPWLMDGLDPGIGDVAIALIAARLACWWWDLGRPRVTTSPGGLRLGGRWFDLQVAPAAITEVRRLAREVVIELGEDESYEFSEDLLLEEPERTRELDEVVTVVERARSENRQEAGAETRRPRRVPSSTSLVALVVFSAWVAAAFLG